MARSKGSKYGKIRPKKEDIKLKTNIRSRSEEILQIVFEMD